jgi:hypothetical protein
MKPLLFFAALVSVLPASAKTYRIGAEREIKSLKAIAPQLQPGDVVEVDSGTYREVLKLQKSGTPEAPIVVRGVGTTRPIFDGENLDTSGRGAIPRAIFQIEGAHIVIENLEFRNARNNHNAAGIRLNGSTNAIVRNCKITRCDMGIFGNDTQTALIETCEVAFNGTEKFNGFSHNFYMHGNRVVVRGCYIHDAPFGQNFKSRAHYNELWFNWISDSNEGEVGFVDAKGETDKPHSNALMVGNIVVSKANRTGNNMKFIDFGADMGNAHDGKLFLLHNTLIAGTNKIKILMQSAPQSRALISGNIFGGEITFEAPAPAEVELGENTSLSADKFADFARRDFRPKQAKSVTFDSIYFDGDGKKHSLKIEEQYQPHLQIVPRKLLTMGALEAAP